MKKLPQVSAVRMLDSLSNIISLNTSQLKLMIVAMNEDLMSSMFLQYELAHLNFFPANMAAHHSPIPTSLLTAYYIQSSNTELCQFLLAAKLPPNFLLVVLNFLTHLRIVNRVLFNVSYSHIHISHQAIMEHCRLGNL